MAIIVVYNLQIQIKYIRIYIYTRNILAKNLKKSMRENKDTEIACPPWAIDAQLHDSLSLTAVINSMIIVIACYTVVDHCSCSGLASTAVKTPLFWPRRRFFRRLSAVVYGRLSKTGTYFIIGRLTAKILTVWPCYDGLSIQCRYPFK